MTSIRNPRRGALKGLAALALATAASLPLAASAQTLTLTVLHNNDGESDFGGDNNGYGDIAMFATTVAGLKLGATSGYSGNAEAVLMLSSGDNFLAGPEFAVSQQDFAANGNRYYDSIALDLVGYDALAIGNHEFDFGPPVFANFVNGFTSTTPPFLSSNLDFTAEPSLQPLQAAGRLAKSTTIEVAPGVEVGIVGATTPLLPIISNPGPNVVVDQDVLAAIQDEVDALELAGVNIIILASHLQNANEERALIPQLTGVDIVIAGGGDELLANADDVLAPGDVPATDGGGLIGYPQVIQDLDGNDVSLITTAGDYKYVGRLIVEVDTTTGVVTSVSDKSGPVVVTPNAVGTQVLGPVEDALAVLAENVIATTQVGLDGVRNNVRSTETNLGNLVCDSFIWLVDANQALIGTSVPSNRIVAIANGGGIRNNNVIPAGDLTELDTFAILPFANFVGIVQDVSPELLKEALENGARGLPGPAGNFAQVGGMDVVYDIAGAPRVIDNNGVELSPGSRVVSVTLDDGTPIIAAGAIVPGAPDVAVATVDFLAKGGDGYPFDLANFTLVPGFSYQSALAEFIESTAPGALGGLVTVADYPEGGEGRITITDSNARVGDWSELD